MSELTDLLTELSTLLHDVLSSVPGVKHLTSMAHPADPPCTVLGPAELAMEGISFGLSSVTFTVILMVDLDDRAEENLYRYVEPVMAALDGVGITVTSASPGTFGPQDLPSYRITVEMDT